MQFALIIDDKRYKYTDNSTDDFAVAVRNLGSLIKTANVTPTPGESNPADITSMLIDEDEGRAQIINWRMVSVVHIVM